MHYAGRAGTGFDERELARLAAVLRPLETAHMPLASPPPRENRFGSPLELSRVHWVRPEVVVEVTYLTWADGGLLRAVSYQGQREDKPAREVVGRPDAFHDRSTPIMNLRCVKRLRQQWQTVARE